jgi:hypothetical protein
MKLEENGEGEHLVIDPGITSTYLAVEPSHQKPKLINTKKENVTHDDVYIVFTRVLVVRQTV